MNKTGIDRKNGRERDKINDYVQLTINSLYCTEVIGRTV